MPEVGPLRVSIVDTTTAASYLELNPIVQGPEGTAECHVESQSGSQFKILITVDPRSVPKTYSYSAHVFVDGKEVARPVLGEIPDKRPTLEVEIHGMRRGPTHRVPFLFGETHFAEGSGNAAGRRFSGLGTIVVRFHRVKVVEIMQTDAPYEGGTPAEDTIVNEGAKKALLIHSVRYGAPIQTSKPQVCACKFIDDLRQPQLTVTFHYRSREILEAKGILTPEPTPQDDGSDKQSDSEEESESEEESGSDPAARIQKLKAENRMLKRKLKETPPIKEEPRLSPEVLDLTSGELKK